MREPGDRVGMQLPSPDGPPADVVPLHGFQGNRGAVSGPPEMRALSVAISRESGSRGGTIARRVGRKLEWPVYDQEVLEYMAQEAVPRQGLIDNLTPEARDWVEARLEMLLREQQLSDHPSVVNLARVILALGAQGQVVLLGRGAGCILPRASTLHVRVIAPVLERIAYMSQWMRLSLEDATERVRSRDEGRDEFLRTYFRRQPSEPHQYDLMLNSGLLGTDLCADLIVQATRTREAQLKG